MNVQADGAFLCPACGAVVRLTEFTGGGGPTIASRPSEVIDGRPRRRKESLPEAAGLDLGIVVSMNGQLV